jgi:hypothetical protein
LGGKGERESEKEKKKRDLGSESRSGKKNAALSLPFCNEWLDFAAISSFPPSFLRTPL